MSIQGIVPSNLPPVGGADRAASRPAVTEIGGQGGGTSFSEVMESAVASVNEGQKNAAQKAGEMAAGVTPIDEAMITMEKADLGFRMMTQVRNKVVDAYKEVMRMNF